MTGKNFRIIEGDDFYNKYEEWLDLYNNSKLTTKDIVKALGITAHKAKQYRQRAIEEDRLKVRGIRGIGRWRI